MSRESGVYNCHGGHRLQQFWNKNINICFHSENSIVLLKNHILYFGEENGKKENSVIGLQHHVGNLWKYEKWIRGIYWLQQCFLPKIFHFLQMFDLAKQSFGWVLAAQTHHVKGGISRVNTCSWLLFIFHWLAQKRWAFLSRRSLRETQVLFICWLWQYFAHVFVCAHRLSPSEVLSRS